MKAGINQISPGLLVLWLTNDCNLNCKYCYANAGEKQEYMTFDTAKKAIDRMGQGGFKLQLAGGEPLMNMPLIREIYDYLRQTGINAGLQLQTNGTLITPELAKEIRAMKIAVGVSLDGGIEMNEALRGQSGKVVEGIRNLSEAGIFVNLNCVLTARNAESLPGLVDMAYYLGNVKGIGLDLLRSTGRAVRNKVKQAGPVQIREALRAAYDRTLQLKRASGRSIVIREIEDAKRRLDRGDECKGYCYAACGGSLVVLPDGSLYPCGSLAGRQEYLMGNVDDGDIRVMALRADKSPECSACRYERLCPGGCPSRLIINRPDSRYSPQDCALRRTAFEIAEERPMAARTQPMPMLQGDIPEPGKV